MAIVGEERHGRILLVFAVVAVLVRAPALLYPVFGEVEAQEAGAAALVRAGAELYRDVPAPEAPLGYWLTAGVYELFGDLSQRWVHLVSILFVLATTAVLGFTARALGGDRAATLAALFYAVFSVVQAPPALGANAELWMLLPLALSAWLVVGGAPGGRYGVLFAAGALAAAGALFRHAGHAFWPAVLAYLLFWRPFLRGRSLLQGGGLSAVSFSLGFVITYAVPLGYLHSRGTLDEYLRDAWTAEGLVPAGAVALNLAVMVLGPSLLWLMAVRDARQLVALRRAAIPLGEDAAATVFAWTWLFAAALAAMAKARGAAADLVPLVPPLTLLAARGAAAIADGFWAGKPARVFRLGVAIPAAVCFGAGIFHEPLYRALGVNQVKVLPIAQAVRERTADSDRLLVLGEARRIYVYARRMPALLAPASELSSADSLPRTLEEAPPTMVVDLEGVRSPALRAWLEKGYTPEAVIEGARLWRRRPR
jgi:4-amino-4-deoxy-L-arabinose transferase-like glycosyltransferase